MIIVSACLAGLNCTYNLEDKTNKKVLQLVKEGKAIPLCPEQLGGLPTPRTPSEQKGSKVFTKEGKDVTAKFQKGAEEVLKIAKLVNSKKTILKARSPSCGFRKIYDGTFTKTLIKGNGVTADLLNKNGIKILTEEDI